MLEDEDEAVTLEPGRFEVLLVVDIGEVSGGNAGGKRSRKEVTCKELKANGVPVSLKHHVVQ